MEGHEDPDSTDEIEDSVASRAEIEWKKAEIEQTRAEMTETITAIKDRLQPQVLMDQAREKVQDATHDAVYRAREATIGRAQDAVENVWYSAREAGTSVANTVRENPIPFALIGIGAAWLLADAMRTRRMEERWSNDYYSAYDQPEPGYGRGTFPGESGDGRGRMRETIGDVKDNLREAAATLRERTSELAGTVKERAAGVADTVRERTGEVADRMMGRVEDVSGRVRERTGEVTGRAAVKASLARMESRDAMGSVSECVQSTMQNNPMALGLVALGLGAAIGFLLPETRREHEMMGETRDRLVDTAKEAAGEVKGKVQTVAQRVQGVATEAIQEAKQTAKEALKEAKQVAAEEARAQGLTPTT